MSIEKFCGFLCPYCEPYVDLTLYLKNIQGSVIISKRSMQQTVWKLKEADVSAGLTFLILAMIMEYQSCIFLFFLPGKITRNEKADA